MPRLAILTFDGFNEIDTFVALNVARRAPSMDAFICAPDETVRSMNGVRIAAQASLEAVKDADAVLIGSGNQTLSIVEDPWVMSRITLDPTRQLVTAQCSGALVLARLGLLAGMPVCTDDRTRPALEAAGVAVLDSPLYALGNVATAGGCLASVYLAAFVLGRLLGGEAARQAVHYVSPVGEKDRATDHAMAVIAPYL